MPKAAKKVVAKALPKKADKKPIKEPKKAAVVVDNEPKERKNWSYDKLQVGHNLSVVHYYKIESVEGGTLIVQTQTGDYLILENMVDNLVKYAWSADHFEKEVKCNLTDLAQILTQCQDTIFKVAFRKKIDQQFIEDKLSNIQFESLSKADELKKITKELQEGNTCEIIGHLVDDENLLGRSLIVDLNAPLKTQFRYVDHRSIEYIIYKNVKYTLGKKEPNTGELPLKQVANTPNWSKNKLAAGNWLSNISYYKMKQFLVGNQHFDVQLVNACDANDDIQSNRILLERDFNCGQAYETEEKITRSEIVTKFMDAKETVMTVNFRKKINDDYVKDILAKTRAEHFTDAKMMKDLSKELASGKNAEMTCRLLGSEGGLGRSNVIDLNAPPGTGFRLIDHRTIDSLILKNVKYTVK